QEQKKQLKIVESVRKMSSESMDSMGRVTLEFPVGANMQEALIKVNTKLAQVPSYPEDAREPVINTSNAANRPIAWFILSQRVPPRDHAEKLIAQHPDLKPALDQAYGSRSEGLKMHRLRRLAAKDERVAKWLPPQIDMS